MKTILFLTVAALAIIHETPYPEPAAAQHARMTSAVDRLRASPASCLRDIQWFCKDSANRVFMLYADGWYEVGQIAD